MLNKYHQIYVDIYGDYANEVERWIAYSMTGDTLLKLISYLIKEA